MATNLKDLIEKIDDDIPTNIFTIEDEDPHVILGKLNEVISSLKNIQATINSSDTKANQALESALLALTNARDSITASTNALNSANKALETANLAIDTANTSLGVASDAKTTSDEAIELSSTANVLANEAKSKADTAESTANLAKQTADIAKQTADTSKQTADIAKQTADNASLISESAIDIAREADDKASSADETATNASQTANSAKDIANNALQIAQNALNQVVGGLGSKVYNTLGQVMTDVKFAGHNGINVDLAEDNETIDIRLDETITKAIEDNHTANQTLAEKVTANETAITDMAPDVARALKVPMSTPTQLKLIGVNTSNDQEMLNVGEGLETSNGNVQVSGTLRGQVQSNTNQISSLAVEVGNKANQSTTYTKTETNNLLSNKANQSTTYTKTETNNLLNAKQNTLVANSMTPNTTRTGQNDTVIDYYLSSDCKTWYRKWKSGWKECGICANVPANNWDTRYTLPLTFSNKNYNVQFTGQTALAKATSTKEVNVIGIFCTGQDANVFVYCCGY